MNKVEFQSKLLEYFKSNNLFDKDINFLVNKVSMELGIKKDDVKRAVAFLMADSKLAVQNGKLVLGDNKDKKLISRNIVTQDIKDSIVVVIRENEMGVLMAYPIDGTSPYEIQQDKIAQKYQNNLCLLHINKDGRKKFGVIKNVIGEESEYEAQILAQLINNHIRLGFDEQAKKQAEEIADLDISDEIKNRADRRKLHIVAVDPEGCKDRDDAIYVQKTEKGYKLYVAITDITHYVKEGSPLWKEAYIRALSHYNPIFSVPMFPRDVTNTIFSLDEGKDRLVLGCEIDFDREGNPTGYRFEKAVVDIHHAMTYEDFEKIHKGDLSSTKFKGEKKLVDDCYELAELLNKKLEKNNKINADTDEPDFVLSEDGKDIIGVENGDKSFSHKVIEMFMIEANCAAGNFFMKNDMLGIYRVHQRLTPERFVELKQILQRYGINYELENTSESMSKLVQQISKLPYSEFIQRIVLSKFFRAQYSPERDIHFGLGFASDHPYSHFTSPARRFADVLAHLFIKDKLEQKKSSYNIYNLLSACSHINDISTVAEKVERRINEFSYCYLANNDLGKTYDCIICRFDSNGVVLRDKKSPMTFVVDYDDLKDGDNRIKFSDNCLSISSGEKSYSLGDEMKCKVSEIDFDERKIYATTNLEKIEENVM